ncbi:MAG: DUF4124 domain-containing protein [Proteobacteria bacterium]|jgi:hypothetical protein|nr:DUF4124 domain-containing protein [Pseudomonadota bacterium]
MNSLHALIVTSLLTGLSLPVAHADTYKWLDETGNVVYSQTPPPDGTAYETLKTIKPSHNSPTPVPAPETSKPVADLKQRTDQRAAEQKKSAEKAKEEELRAKNCQAANKNLEVYTRYKRIRKEDGEVVRIPDDVRAQKIEEYKKAVKEYCD